MKLAYKYPRTFPSRNRQFDKVKMPVGVRKKLSRYLTVPSFHVSTTWLGASSCVLKFNFAASGNFSITKLPIRPVGANFCPCLWWKDGTTVYRFKLWENAGEILYVPLYDNRKLPAQFSIEIWTCENEVDATLTPDFILYSSILDDPILFCCGEAETPLDDTMQVCQDNTMPLADKVWSGVDGDYWTFDSCGLGTFVDLSSPIQAPTLSDTYFNSNAGDLYLRMTWLDDGADSYDLSSTRDGQEPFSPPIHFLRSELEIVNGYISYPSSIYPPNLLLMRKPGSRFRIRAYKDQLISDWSSTLSIGPMLVAFNNQVFDINILNDLLYNGAILSGDGSHSVDDNDVVIQPDHYNLQSHTKVKIRPTSPQDYFGNQFGKILIVAGDIPITIKVTSTVLAKFADTTNVAYFNHDVRTATELVSFPNQYTVVTQTLDNNLYRIGNTPSWNVQYNVPINTFRVVAFFIRPNFALIGDRWDQYVNGTFLQVEII